MSSTATHPFSPTIRQGIARHLADSALHYANKSRGESDPVWIAEYESDAAGWQTDAASHYALARKSLGIVSADESDPSAMEGADALPRLVILSDDTIREALALPYLHGLVVVWNAILTACGQPKLGDSDEPIKPGRYRIPQAQSAHLLREWMSAPGVSSGDGVHIGLHWVNVGPSSHE